MLYLKSILVGFVIAILTLVLVAAAIAAVSIIDVGNKLSSGLGAVGGYFSIPVIPLLIVGTIMFAAGFIWEFRRSIR